jgi:hypothetical protein
VIREKSGLSDFDIALASRELLERASALGIGLRSGGTRTGPLRPADPQSLGLSDLASALSGSAGRPVNFLILRIRGCGDGACAEYGSAMTKRFWLLGSHDEVAVVGRRLAEALGVDLAEHDSDYLGGAYLRGSARELEEVIVRPNFEDEEGYLAEEDFAAYRTLTYITQEAESGPLPSMDGLGIHVLRVEEL